MSKMDQSTQVDFPIVVRKMRRHNTSADLFATNRGHGNSWNHSKVSMPRPKSLNFPDPLTNRAKIIYYSDSPLSRLPLPVSDLHLGSISRERTPPFSCSSSVASTSSPTYKPDPSCQCSNDSIYCRRIPANSTQGLSWRRLHMSRAKLKATATTSELLSGFAMVAMVELQINDDTAVPEWLFVIFAVCTTVLVAVHIFALMISTYILPNIDAVAKLEICEMVAESPHERMRGFIELAWAFSTVLGLFLFLVEVAILCWVKFWDYSFTAATAATVIVIPVLITFVLFAVHFYHSLVVYKCNSSVNDMEKLENMKKHLDEVTSPV
ncbi:calcium release-activated calcium channel protein 1-like [Tribolium madens]|uniref:calcium release-activated calcium channel protein 1-like n=1 Tax=Tribolium madens TaxID=41895 RepID=UPI001CF74AE0|nr:calcium release-activated calcium channel protein 1-like [Tribolium madens]